jgi:hypothetical protein
LYELPPTRIDPTEFPRIQEKHRRVLRISFLVLLVGWFAAGMTVWLDR